MIPDNRILIYSLALTLAGIACVTDLKSRRIPNSLVLAGLCLGVGLNLWDDGLFGLGRSFIGGALGLAIFLPFFALGGMGAGDVKLLSALGALLGPAEILQVALAAALAGGLLAVVAAARRQRLGATVRAVRDLFAFWIRGGLRPSPELTLSDPTAVKIPYALPVAAGTVLVALSRWS